IYLVAPPDLDLEVFPDRLARVLDGVDVACLRFGLATADADRLGRAADGLRAIAHERDVPSVVESRLPGAPRPGLVAVPLDDESRTVREARKALGADAIVGAFCGVTRHEGMNAGEAGADYVAFGPVGETLLGGAARADRDLFAWWSEMIEIPVVAEGGLTPALVAELAPVSDFLGIGPEIWGADDPLAALRALLAPLD